MQFRINSPESWFLWVFFHSGWATVTFLFKAWSCMAETITKRGSGQRNKKPRQKNNFRDVGNIHKRRTMNQSAELKKKKQKKPCSLMTLCVRIGMAAGRDPVARCSCCQPHRIYTDYWATAERPVEQSQNGRTAAKLQPRRKTMRRNASSCGGNETNEQAPCALNVSFWSVVLFFFVHLLLPPLISADLC